MALVPAYVYAVDGQVLINQATLTAAGGTYPITTPGSYKLSGNLQAKDKDTNVIVISASHVTLDLNGFAILGTTNCAGGLNPCAGAGTGVGIAAAGVQFNITIRNGTIQGMGNVGILLFGDSHLVEYLHVRSNGGIGIEVEASADQGGSIVQYNTVQRNGGSGIFIERGSASHNVLNTNLLYGIDIYVGSASYNVSAHNLAGIHFISGGSDFGNTLNDNTVSVAGGVNLGQNLCNNVACP